MTKSMKLMIGSAFHGGMSSVVEAFERDGFLAAENVRVVFAYREGHFAARQIVLIRALAVYIRCLPNRRVELVHCHASVWGSLWRKGVFASHARLFGIPVVLHLHGSEMKQFLAAQRPRARPLVRRHLEKATRAVVLSDSWKAFIAAIAPKASTAVVPNDVRLPPGRERDRQSEDMVLFLGLIGPHKGTFDLIRAFAAMRNRHPRARLVLGGNGQVAEATQLATDYASKTALSSQAGWMAMPRRNSCDPRRSMCSPLTMKACP
jgi:glycosyltransferase involved in cell wall biosynthesis